MLLYCQSALNSLSLSRYRVRRPILNQKKLTMVLETYYIYCIH